MIENRQIREIGIWNNTEFCLEAIIGEGESVQFKEIESLENEQIRGKIVTVNREPNLEWRKVHKNGYPLVQLSEDGSIWRLIPHPDNVFRRANKI